MGIAKRYLIENIVVNMFSGVFKYLKAFMLFILSPTESADQLEKLLKKEKSNESGFSLSMALAILLFPLSLTVFVVIFLYFFLYGSS